MKGYQANDVSFATAEIWLVNTLYSSKKWPVSLYQGPTLILSGEFDPWTPTWYGSQAMELLPNAEKKIYPERTHLPGFTQDGMADIESYLSEISNEAQN